MPVLSVSTIQKLCSNQTTYIRGLNYAVQNRVTIEECVTEDIALNTFSASVDGSGRNQYTVRVTLSDHNRKIESVHCNCPAFEEYQGICKHVVATLLHLLKQFSGTAIELTSPSGIAFSSRKAPSQRTDDAGNLLLQEFATRATLEVQAALSTGDIRLVSELHAYYGTLYLTFSVGRERLYIIKNTKSFLRSFVSGELVSYGKQLTFTHHLAQFDAQSRETIAFMQAYFTNADSSSASSAMTVPYNMLQRSLVLSPKNLDDFLQLHLNTILPCELPQTPDTLAVTDGTPHVKLTLDATETGGYQIYMDKPMRALFGLKYVYLPIGNTLYRCDERFSAETIGFWRALKRSAHGNKMLFSSNDMQSVCATVLPVLRTHFEITESCDLSEVTPPPLTASLYLDTNELGDVLGRLEFCYGSQKHTAFRVKNRQGVFDIARETLIEQTVLRYFDEINEDGTALLHSEHEDKLFVLASEGTNALSQLCEIYTSDSFQSIQIKPPMSASIGVRLESGLLHLEMDLGDFEPAELEMALHAYRRNKRYYRLRDGSFLDLQSGSLSELSQITQGLNITAKQMAQGEITVNSYYTLYLNELLKKSHDLAYDRDKSFKEIVRNIHNVQETDFELPPSLKHVLRSYQKDGYRWIRTLCSYGFGGILADDMGLGKTLQVLCVLLAQQMQTETHAPSLVVCPSSLVLNWQSEAQRFAPELRVVVVQGIAAVRAQTMQDFTQADLIITSYDSLKRDIEQYEAIHFLYVVADEAQYMKNQNTQNAKAVKALCAQYRLALTGTPIENSLAELWSIFDFLMPGYLYHYSQFRKRFEVPIVRQNDADASQRLQAMVAPFVLRRMKQEVLHELPDKTETVLCATLSEQQHKLYAATALEAQQILQSDLTANAAGRFQLLALLTRMRQLCCDPSLVFENYASGSAKLELCLDLIGECIQSGHRLLLFSQFTSMLDILAARLREANIEYFMLTGSTKPADRLALVNTFNAGSTPVFLISLKAGGTGLNLTGADTVIHYDPWWNVSAQNQASDRAYRIGQTKKVQVYKLIASGTIEERILRLQQRKSELADLVMTENNGAFAQLSKDELAALFAGE